MASLYFTYSAMNAGKSTSLLQVAYNYEERDQQVLLLTPALDTRAGEGFNPLATWIVAQCGNFHHQEQFVRAGQNAVRHASN